MKRIGPLTVAVGLMLRMVAADVIYAEVTPPEQEKRETLKKEEAEAAEEPKIEAIKKETWDYIANRMVDPDLPSDKQDYLAERYAKHIDEKWRALLDEVPAGHGRTGFYQEFYGFRIYSTHSARYEIYNAKVERVKDCPDDKCLCEWKMNELSEVMRSFDLRPMQRQALTYEYQQLAAEYQRNKKHRRHR